MALFWQAAINAKIATDNINYDVQTVHQSTNTPSSLSLHWPSITDKWWPYSQTSSTFTLSVLLVTGNTAGHLLTKVELYTL